MGFRTTGLNALPQRSMSPGKEIKQVYLQCKNDTILYIINEAFLFSFGLFTL